MAELTHSLPLTQGTNRVIDDPASPSMVGGALGFLSEALDGYMDLRRQNAADARQKAEDERRERAAEAAYKSVEAYDRAVGTARQSQVEARTVGQPVEVDAPRGFSEELEGMTGTVFGQQSSILNPAQQNKVESRGQFIANVAAAVDQGKMPAISLTTALNTEFRRLVNEMPDQTEHIIDIWKKMGVDTTLFREGRDLADWQDHERETAQKQVEADQKFDQDMFEFGMKSLPSEWLTTGGTNGGPMSREEVIAYGLSQSSIISQLELAKKQADLQLTKAQGKQQEVEFIEKDRNQKIEQFLMVGIHNDSGPLKSVVQNIVSTLSKLPPGEQASQWQQHAPRINMMLNNYVDQAVAAAVARGYTGSVDTLRSNLTSQVDSVRELWTGEFSVAEGYIKALNLTETTLKLNTAQAVPVFTALRTMGINADQMVGYMEGLQGNTELQNALREEMMGFSTDFGQERASTRLLNIVKMLRGELSLAEMTGDQARRELPGLYRTTKANIKLYNEGRDIPAETIVNGLGELTIATRTLGPSSGIGAITTATAGFATPAARKALVKAIKDPNSGDEAKAVAMATRAASANILEIVQSNIPKINQGNRFFKIVWDDRNGTYKVDDSAKRQMVAKMSKLKAPAGDKLDTQSFNMQKNSLLKLQPPKEMQAWVDAANANLGNIIELAPYDENTPKASNLELRNYYGRNITPESMRGEGATPEINPEKELQSQFDTLDEILDESSGKVSPVRIPKDWTESAGYEKVAPVVKTVAAEMGIPEQLAINLIGEESSFDPGAQGPVIAEGSHKGDRAMGLGQVMAKTAAKFGVTDRAGLDVEGQVRLAFRVLKANYEETGNWKDAVSMYFTGDRYDKAVARGANDRFESVVQYVKDAMEGVG